MKEFLIGTSGYDYPEWKGVFYPQEIKRQDFLSYYATQFNALELNFSFYGMPDANRMQSFYDRTEGKVKFSVKANQSLTHKIDSSWQNSATDFKNALEPLVKTNTVSSVLFQFPESFHYTNDNRIYLAKLINEFAGFPVVVEFRHKEWVRESVFAGLEKMKATLCFCDMPRLKNLPDMGIERLNHQNQIREENSVSVKDPFIGPAAYIRLHGRNENAWYTASNGENDRGQTSNSSNGSARYDYDYSAKELSQFVPVVNSGLNANKIVSVFFNNHPGGSGAKNALLLRNLVKLSNFGLV